jgi:BolA protein
MQKALTQAFSPLRLEITDESSRHAGHAERNGLAEGETHYHILLVSPVWRGQSRVARSRAVHATLDSEFQDGLHALSLTLRTPEEAEQAAA